MPQSPGDVVRKRAARLREASDQAWSRRLKTKVGQTLSVLMERGGIGRAEDFTPVRVEGVGAGTLCDVIVEANDRDELTGRLAV
jgi:threonylcarbamoyladenosine tRNA methylthiotransferase MtaB